MFTKFTSNLFYNIICILNLTKKGNNLMSKVELRKMQKSRTGFYVNIPKSVSEKLALQGEEAIKIELDEENKKIVMTLIDL